MPKFLAHIDLSKSQLRNAVIQPLTSDPAGSIDGQIYYNTGSNELMISKAGTWTPVDNSYTSNVELSGNNLVITGHGNSFSGSIDLSSVATEDNYADSLAFNTGNGILTIGRTGVLADLTVDLDGRYLLSGTKTWGLQVNGGTPTSILPTTDVNFKNGTDITVTQDTTTSLTVNHNAITRTNNTSATSPAHGGTFTVIDSITSSATGHITAVNTKTVTLPADLNTDVDVSVANLVTRLGQINTNWTIGNNSALEGTIAGKLTIAGDLVVEGSTTWVESTNTYLVDNVISLNAPQVGNSPQDPVSKSGFEVVRLSGNVELIWNETTDKWQIETNGATNTYENIATENYVSSAIGNGTITVQGTGGLTGSNTFTVNQSGNTTVTLQHADTSAQSSVDNSGLTFIQDVTLDTYGHVIGLASGTVTLPTVNDGTLTISNGGGITGSGTFTANQAGNTSITIAHADTSSQASVNNSGLTVIQDVTLDTYGHVTGLSSQDLTSDITTLVNNRSYTALIGNGTLTSIPVSHGLNSLRVLVELVDEATQQTVYADVFRTNTSTVTIGFTSAPATNSIRVMIYKIQ